jgi:hypothetical protein
MNLAASLALGGGPGVFGELKKVLAAGPAGPRLPLIEAVFAAASGEQGAALEKLNEFSASRAEGQLRAYGDAYKIAINAREKARGNRR